MFLPDRFPERISFHATGGAGWSTTVVSVESGRESRDQAWSMPLHRYEVSHALREPVDYVPLRNFFMIARGRTHTFAFKDWQDFEATSEEGIFVELTSTTFQMYKRYAFGTATDTNGDPVLRFDREITLPVVATIQVAGATATNIERETGIVTVASGTPTGWSGEFDVRCRFDTDEMKGEIIDRSGRELLMGWQSIPIIEVRP